jgi:hypothetical protein
MTNTTISGLLPVSGLSGTELIPVDQTDINGNTGTFNASIAQVVNYLQTNTPAPPATTLPLMDGTAAVGTGLHYARNDHVHPSDTSRLSAATGGTLAAGVPINFLNSNMYIMQPLLPGGGPQDGASIDTCDLALGSSYGIGLGPHISGQPMPSGLYSWVLNSRTGDVIHTGLRVMGAGNGASSQIQNLNFTRSGTSQYIQCTANTAQPSIGSIQSGGSGIQVNDRFYDNVTNSTYTVTAVDGTGAATAITMNMISGYNSSPLPTNPITLKAAPGFATGRTAPSVNLTWTVPATLALQHTAGSILVNASGNVTVQSSSNNIVVDGASGITLTGKVNVPTGVVGVTDNSSAAAGMVGEHFESAVADTTVSLTNNTPANVTSITLGAGDYDVGGEVWFHQTGVGATSVSGAITTTSATFPGQPAANVSRTSLPFTSVSGAEICIPIAVVRISLAASSSCFLVGQASFGAGTITAGGTIRARRRR